MRPLKPGVVLAGSPCAGLAVCATQKEHMLENCKYCNFYALSSIDDAASCAPLTGVGSYRLSFPVCHNYLGVVWTLVWLHETPLFGRHAMVHQLGSCATVFQHPHLTLCCLLSNLWHRFCGTQRVQSIGFGKVRFTIPRAQLVLGVTTSQHWTRNSCWRILRLVGRVATLTMPIAHHCVWL